MRITMVKKILTGGSPCKKCAEVEQRLEQAGLSSRIDQILIADERDPDSEGMRLASLHKVDIAPFFIVEHDDGSTETHTTYFRFVKEVLETQN